MARPTRPRFIARSRAMRALDEQIRRFADSDSNVLIAGETGTGKNAVATELHARGPRAKRPFVAIDCASLSATLIDSELFGHERGAFTDAVTARAGRFELAGSGTVYLDAVTELPIEAQGKLLRIVEEKRVERLGGHASMAVSARIVASADARIEDAVRAGEFRHDLYHRLRVLPIFLPPLRERADDVLPLARYFLARVAATTRRAAPRRPLARGRRGAARLRLAGQRPRAAAHGAACVRCVGRRHDRAATSSRRSARGAVAVFVRGARAPPDAR